jgi:hypothetical protein
LVGDWLLPDPVSFVLSPVRRQAARRAIEHVEQQGGPRPLYWTVLVVRSGARRHVVWVAVGSGLTLLWRPRPRRRLAVSPDGAVEELYFGRVPGTHGFWAAP